MSLEVPDLLEAWWHASGKAEVTEFDGTVGLDEDVSSLEVSVDNVGLVEESHRRDASIKNFNQMMLIKIDWESEHFFDISLGKLHHDADLVDTGDV